MDLQEMVWGDMDLTDLVQDRGSWQALVEARRLGSTWRLFDYKGEDTTCHQ